ncbi:SAM-dependent methyltransferase, partial [Metarhizium majus ARSEF 297]
MPSFTPLAAEAAGKIASYAILDDPKHLAVEIGQAEHRIGLVNSWQIQQGSRVLEIGCGQGTCTAVLAEAVGPEGHVDAVDPGPPDYGAPLTLAQAQAHLSAGPVGDRITWYHAEPVRFLAENPGARWDFVVLAHCIWYFDGPDTLGEMLAALRGRAAGLLVAEYALTARERAAVPHVMAAVARAALEAHNKASEANIRCLLGPLSIKDAAARAGWALDKEEVHVPGVALLDGSWETGTVKSKWFLEEIDKYITDVTLKTTLLSAREAVVGAVGLLNGEKVRTMDVWVSRFV